MPISDCVCCFALRQVGLEGFEAASKVLVNHYSDQGKLLLRALDRSNRAAWKALEVALTGESLWSKMTSRADAKAFRQQIRLFLDRITLPELTSKEQYRQQCLKDLRDALGKGVLLGELVPAALIERTGPLVAYAEPQQLMRVEKQALNRLAVEVHKAGFQSLAWLLDQPAHGGDSVIVLAVRYFFRREVERTPQLAAGLQLTAMEDLGTSQREGFDNLMQTLEAFEDRFEQVLQDAQGTILVAVGDLRAVVVTQGEQVHGRLEGMEQTLTGMQSRMDQLLERLGMLNQPVRAGHSLSIRNDRERQLVKELLANYRELPSKVREHHPELVSKMGKLLLAAGDFHTAEETFEQAARMATSHDARAESHHNAYRASLEQKEYDNALRQLLQASAIAPDRYAPFPLDRYEPVRILGAGGFGVTFLCQHALSKGKVAVKSLTTEDMDRDGATVVQEAGTLEQIKHPAVIAIRDCGFADRERRRPYLVMEYFDGPTLEDHVQSKGTLPLSDVLTIARTLAEAIDAAHSKRLLHRDIKPANVLLKNEAGLWNVRIIDFGLALSADLLSQAGTTLKAGKTTTASAIAGTIDYAAPEQLGKLANNRVGPAADVYGYGRTLTFALFGTPEATWHQYKTLPNDVAEFLSKCVQQQPTDRPQSFVEVLGLLDGLRKSGSRAEMRPLLTKAASDSVVPTVELVEERSSERRARFREDYEDREERPRSRPMRTTTGARITHAVLAILFGGFGIHKFLQDNSQAGMIRLLLILTCIGLYANIFIGWIEGIKYLTMTNEAYEQDYYIDKKGWF